MKSILPRPKDRGFRRSRALPMNSCGYCGARPTSHEAILALAEKFLDLSEAEALRIGRTSG